jgi:3-deoxy-D-manno-octulosonic-acid transferase
MTRARSPLLTLYGAAARAVSPLATLFLKARARAGKEDPARLVEKLGRPSLARPEGPLIWLHGASIGESLALLPLIGRLQGMGYSMLATTGTRASAELLRDRLPPAALHQYAPLDIPSCLDRFLSHWRPDALILAESELWPNLLAKVEGAGAPIALVNGRMSERSFARWSRAPKTAQALLSSISVCLAQSEADRARFAALGAGHAQVVGNLKHDVRAPPADGPTLAALRAAIGLRPAWAAISTHAGEENACFAAHAQLLRQAPDALLIIAPRDARRGREIIELASAFGLTARLRSAREAVDAQVYVADTYGEIGLWLRLAPLAFLGNSLNGGRGQNAIEPAKLNVACLHGPSVEAFVDVYDALDRAGGALRLQDAQALGPALCALMGDIAALRAMGRQAYETIIPFTGATDRTIAALTPLLAQIDKERAP